MKAVIGCWQCHRLVTVELDDWGRLTLPEVRRVAEVRHALEHDPEFSAWERQLAAVTS